MVSFIIPVLINMTKSVISAKGLNQYYVSSGYKEIFTAYLKNIHVISLVMVCDSPLFLFSRIFFTKNDVCFPSIAIIDLSLSPVCVCVLQIWANYEEKPVEEVVHVSEEKERVANYRAVYVTEISDTLHFYTQDVETGNFFNNTKLGTEYTCR